MDINQIKRRDRLRIAREKGSHTKLEWDEMLDFFENTCVKCFGESGLYHVEKDHITPLYQGGSDGIDNIQPMCARCNASKGPDRMDYRPQLSDLLGKELPNEYKLK